MFGPLSSPIVNPIANMATAATPWYLSGGIAAANCIAAYAPKGAASLAASYSNLANPGTYDLTAPAGNPTWNTTNGWVGGGNKYLATGISPTLDQTWSVAIRYSDPVNANQSLFGSDNASNRAFYYTCRLGLGNSWATGTGGTSIAYVSGTIFIMAGKDGYIDGILKGAASAGTAVGNHLPLFILCRNINGTPSGYFTGKIQAFSIYDTTISAVQVAALTTAMNAL